MRPSSLIPERRPHPMMEWLKKLLGNSNDAEVKKLSKIVDQVEALEGEY